VAKTERTDKKRLEKEYKDLVQGLVAAGTIADTDDMFTNPALSCNTTNYYYSFALLLVPVVICVIADILQEAIPGNIRRAKHFLMFLRTLVEYVKTKLKGNIVTTGT
jgi:DNA excision repair protein ERCC-2